MKTIIASLLGLGTIGFLSGCSMAAQKNPASSNAGTASSVGPPAYSTLHSEIMRSY
jgi:hypothetical protein